MLYVALFSFLYTHQHTTHTQREGEREREGEKDEFGREALEHTNELNAV